MVLLLCICVRRKFTFDFVTQFPPSKVAEGDTSLKRIFILPLSLKTHCNEQSAAAWRIDLKRLLLQHYMTSHTD
ncbi:hypothetical protein AV530_012848 [Patagioenas fasciata monilis]|uniref:Uncharacterized protein n=1 Tax=Patagioenas fasciata monilis TaxID=372326 RepID=A0A1V4J9N5_PATFA|nr:hypothetical protein AV530_012848 [Patagioenas fasciata monilis]